LNDRQNFQLKLTSEFEIALIMAGNPHDRTSAIAHQGVISDPDWNALTIDGFDPRRPRFF